LVGAASLQNGNLYESGLSRRDKSCEYRLRLKTVDACVLFGAVREEKAEEVRDERGFSELDGGKRAGQGEGGRG